MRIACVALSVLATGCLTPIVEDRPTAVRSAPPPVPAVYRYSGPHHVPDAWGGGWCYVDGEHEHDYAPQDRGWYRYERGVYTYSAPIVATYWDVHPDELGGWCYLHGAHTHGYLPPKGQLTHYQWDRQRHAYRYVPHDADPVLAPSTPAAKAKDEEQRRAQPR